MAVGEYYDVYLRLSNRRKRQANNCNNKITYNSCKKNEARDGSMRSCVTVKNHTTECFYNVLRRARYEIGSGYCSR